MRRHLRDLLGIDDPMIDGASYGGTTSRRDPRPRAQRADLPLQDDARMVRSARRGRRTLRAAQHTEQVYDDPQVVNNGSILSVEHERVGEIRMPGHPVHYSESQVSTPSAPPVLGDATQQTLEQLGYARRDRAPHRTGRCLRQAALSPSGGD